MFGLGPQEMIVVLVLGVLLFGKRLPEVGRSLGKGIVEFKKGIRGIEEELDVSSYTSTSSSHSVSSAKPAAPSWAQEGPDLSVPKFEPPTAAPVAKVATEEMPRD